MASENRDSQLFLLLENSSKANNLGSIIRCASAFGITTIVTIGFAKCSVQGSHGASKNISIVAFPTGDQAEKYLRQEQHCTTIIGLMGPLPNGYQRDDCPVHNDPTTKTVMFTLDDIRGNRHSTSLDVVRFTGGNICVAVSKEKQGLPLSISCCCDSLVHIPHLPLCGNSPLLDTPSSLSILLSALCESIGFDERAFHENKFNVTRPEQHTNVNNERQRYSNVQEIIEDDEAEDEALGSEIIRQDDLGDY